MLLNASRMPARADGAGNLLRLAEQDRSKWDGALIARGMRHLARSAAGEELSEYHLQAGIAACHAEAREFEATDWARILALYDRLSERDGSPVVALNRAVAVAKVHGPRAGLEAVASIAERESLDGYYLYHAVMGEFEAELGRPREAARHFRAALGLVEMPSERVFLERRIGECEAGAEERGR
jgi:RNA polymerase sigma-70 factor (ECF subfamily)